MTKSAPCVPQVRAGWLDPEVYDKNFSDLHPPLTPHEAMTEADRCYFCFDAPCVSACPTGINIPLFIRQIQATNPIGAAVTILEENILGGMCARVCPTEDLCEQACVREVAEGKPVKIGHLQRYATDHLMQKEADHPFSRQDTSGKRIAVVGAGPAGLACAHGLSRHGHAVTIFEARDKPGGLNEYGIASYKTLDNFAQREVGFVLALGGITIETGKTLGEDLSLDALCENYDAVFLGLGLGGTNRLGIEDEALAGVHDAVDFIARLRQSDDLAQLPVGRRVVVIGGGMTAIDAAIQARLLGAEEVTIVYRGPRARMRASGYEQELALTRGVHIKDKAQPLRFCDNGAGHVQAVSFVRTAVSDDGRFAATDAHFEQAADMVLVAIGQTFPGKALANAREPVALAGGRIKVDGLGRTNLDKVWAGGDCTGGGNDLTVTAVEEGKRAAAAIHVALTDA